MRIAYSEDEGFPGQFELWQANCDRSLHGKSGQRALRDLEAALLALPDKRLIVGLLTDDEGGVCAVGAYAQYKGVDLLQYDPEDSAELVGMAAGMPRLVAWAVVEHNDFIFDRDDPTPEERYTRVLHWVRHLLAPREK
jgi:hypothetical protein